MTDDLIARLLAHANPMDTVWYGDLTEAADALEAKDKRIEWLEEWIRTINGAALARIAALEAALKPFADAANDYVDDEDDEPAYLKRFSIGTLRAARAALEEK